MSTLVVLAARLVEFGFEFGDITINIDLLEFIVNICSDEARGGPYSFQFGVVIFRSRGPQVPDQLYFSFDNSEMK